MSDVAIDVKNVTKLYKLYDKPSDRLFESLGLSRKKKYHEHYALGGVNFTINKGDCVGIIGTNGAGKSTILKIITGVLNPTSGSVEIDGRISALLELGAGFNMEYTGIENVYLNGSMIGFSREEIDERLDDIIAFAKKNPVPEIPLEDRIKIEVEVIDKTSFRELDTVEILRGVLQEKILVPFKIVRKEIFLTPRKKNHGGRPGHIQLFCTFEKNFFECVLG